MEGEHEVLTWADFDRSIWQLAERVAADGVPDAILSIACGGLLIYAEPRSVVLPDDVWRDTGRCITFSWTDRPPVTGHGVCDS